MHTPATLVRGGTSKCWLFNQVHVPADRAELEKMLVAAYGAGDPVELDGVGGATPTTSKAAIVSASPEPGVDVDYLFAQVGIGTGAVEWTSNCGNCATGVALYAVAKGMVPITGDRTRVVMRNTNTGAVLEGLVDTTGGVVHHFGRQTVPGTRAGGVAVGLTFREPAGGTTGLLLPTGRAAEELRVGTAGPVRVSMVDAGAPVVLVDAGSAGRTGAETLERMQAEVPWLRTVRHAAAPLMGLFEPGLHPGAEPGDAVPKVGLVGPPVPYTTTLGERVASEDYDISVRMLTMNAPHPAVGLTSAVAVAAAGLLEDSVVSRAAGGPTDEWLRLGTPAGVVAVRCTDVADGLPRRVTVQRAARLLADARIYVPETGSPQAA
ncbi:MULTISPECIES: PrpF domain-containing protein [Streptomyces]|uniref:3-methylitaconate isomerase n=1 Tax=Streptomyces chartreusis NRRL 3882 TaxID=1079985 RepID=A0A2N9BJG3_STRCX|nr:PrpF domain-containing protein [Streptomyces chartreusis]MYS95024.1 PrpF, AcnD-accessory [Streptomyces sp. SID5464]SOR83483.1 3-methylitaconate isomerase [Streptomyces chartreusis NRRL 3882]